MGYIAKQRQRRIRIIVEFRRESEVLCRLLATIELFRLFLDDIFLCVVVASRCSPWSVLVEITPKDESWPTSELAMMIETILCGLLVGSVDSFNTVRQLYYERRY